MDQIIKMVTEKAGISEGQAKTAVETVMSFLKDKMPDSMSEQISSLMAGDTSSVADVAGDLKDKLGF